MALYWPSTVLYCNILNTTEFSLILALYWPTTGPVTAGHVTGLEHPGTSSQDLLSRHFVSFGNSQNCRLVSEFITKLWIFGL